jgi:SAM-dependent methyltransferase
LTGNTDSNDRRDEATPRDVVARTIRNAYETGDTYAVRRICAALKPDSGEYADRLLHDKVETVLRHYSGGVAVDLCCATGEHLLTLAPRFNYGVGLDFSRRYLIQAKADAETRGITNVCFVVADATRIPLADASVDLLYSFSSLYAIPNAADVVVEVSRILRPGGVCVLDMGNRTSLNALCTRYYTEWPPVFPLPYRHLRRMLRNNGLLVIEHRAFQLLPLWAARPRWLAPLLHPGWKALLGRRLGARMLDEWISRLPVMRRLAFRHLFVCRRR